MVSSYQLYCLIISVPRVSSYTVTTVSVQHLPRSLATPIRKREQAVLVQCFETDVLEGVGKGL